MTWTPPVRYPNTLEQNDPEGALNTYVIDNIQHLYDNTGGGDVALLYQGTGNGYDVTPFIIADVISSTYSDYRIYIDYQSISSSEYPVFQWADALGNDTGSWNGTYVEQNGITLVGGFASSMPFQLGTNASSVEWSNSIIDLSFPNATFTAVNAIGHVTAIGSSSGFNNKAICQNGNTVTTPTGIGIASSASFGLELNVRVYGFNGIMPS